MNSLELAKKALLSDFDANLDCTRVLMMGDSVCDMIGKINSPDYSYEVTKSGEDDVYEIFKWVDVMISNAKAFFNGVLRSHDQSSLCHTAHRPDAGN